MGNAHVCIDKKWWKQAVVYQIYPRSFYDSNGDGIGDLRGIIEKIDYISSLGIDVIWLNPVYESPNDDNGYDISNYFGIMQEFGTMSDWEELLSAVHEHGMKLIMDLVVNHTSDEHQWFVQSRSSRENRYRDYYIWHDAVDGHEPSDWGSHFSGSAWQWDEQTGQYYLHLFTRKQPDLNWENEAVRKDVFTMMRWWLDKGIDGFRMDTINMLSKIPGFPSVEKKFDGKFRYAGKYFNNGPRIHEFLKEMNRKTLSDYDIMTVGECPDVSPETALKYVAPEEKELNMLFQFEHMSVDYINGSKWDMIPFDLVKFKSVISKWQTGMHGRGWNSNYLMNHDQPRAVSRYGNEGRYRKESAKMLLAFTLTLEGTPYIYQGEEIGMINSGLTDISQYRDVEVKNHYKEVQAAGGDTSAAVKRYMKMSRDNARTPMQWSGSLNAGFSTGTPWIEPGHSWKEINVEKDLSEPDSVIEFFRKAVSLRKKNEELIYGSYEILAEKHSAIFAYHRKLEKNISTVILNFSTEEISLNTDELMQLKTAAETGELMLCNYSDLLPDEKTVIRPFEVRVYKKINN